MFNTGWVSDKMRTKKVTKSNIYLPLRAALTISHNIYFDPRHERDMSKALACLKKSFGISRKFELYVSLNKSVLLQNVKPYTE